MPPRRAPSLPTRGARALFRVWQLSGCPLVPGTRLPSLGHEEGPPCPLPPHRQDQEGFADPACERHHTSSQAKLSQPIRVLRRVGSRDAPRDSSLRPRAMTAMFSAGCFPCKSYKCLSLSWQLMSHFSAASQPAPGVRRDDRRAKLALAGSLRSQIPKSQRGGWEGSGCLARDRPSPSSTAWSWGQGKPSRPPPKGASRIPRPHRSHAGTGWALCP